MDIIGFLLAVFFVLSVYEFHKSIGEIKSRLKSIEEKLDQKKGSK